MSGHEVTNYTDRFRRLATAATIASLFSYASVLLVTPAANNKIQAFYKVSIPQLAWLPLAIFSAFFVAVLAAGTYSDKHGKLPSMLAGCAAMALGSIIFACTTRFPVAVSALFLMGIGGGLSEGTSMALIADLYHGRRKTGMMNISQAAFGVGAVTSPLLIGWFIRSGVNWRMGYWTVAGFCMISGGIALAALLMREEKPHTEHHTPGAWRGFIADPRVLLWALCLFLYVGAELGQSNWMSVYLKKDLAASDALAAASASLLWIGITAGRMAIAWLARHLAETTVVVASLAGAALCQAALLLVGSPNLALCMSLLLGVFLGPVFPTITSIAGAAYPRQSGVVLGIIVACGAAGGAAFTPTIGLAEAQLGIRGALWTCFALLSINLVSFAAASRLRHRAT